MNFTPIHNHSQYSALDGLSTPLEIAQRCLAIGCDCCGLTDHATVAGHLEFGKVMQKHGIKPIYGCELYHGVKTEFGKNERDQAHFVAGAMTDEGLRNLWRLVDAASTNFRYVGRVNWDMLERYSEGLFATSACMLGLLPKAIENGGDLSALNRYLDIFGDRFYIELHCYPDKRQEELNLNLVQIAQERGVPVVYATDAHFASPEQYEIHDAYVAMQTGESVYMDPSERKMWHPKALYIKDEQEIRESLSYLPENVVDEALANSSLIASQCDAQLPEIRRHLPAFIPSECPWLDKKTAPATAAELFIDLVEQGLVERYGEDAPDEVWDRASREMEVFFEAPGPITGGGLEHYFLQAWDFCEFCNRNNIKRGPGRGSAAGSIVAYALGITDVDPLHYDLFFERFYNPGRAKGFPDIDNDFPKADRKRVRDYLKDRWGHDKVRTIGTTMRLKPKAACDKTYKACAVTFEEKEALKKIVAQVPDIDILGAASIGWSRDVDPGKTIYVMHSTEFAEHDTGTQIVRWLEEQAPARQPILAYWLDVVATVCSRVSGYGVHPSGVVVSDVALDDELPCMWNSNQAEQVTCFPMDDVDSRQFVKQDLLGLKNLDILQDWEDQLAAEGIDIVWSGLERELHEDAIWTLLDRGETLNIFQIEDGYARQLCKQFKPRSVEDLSIIVALNRPGPIRSGAPDSFIARRNGETDDKFDGRQIPLLAEILEPTYGWFLYQEQVIAYFSKLGYDLSEADAVRKILGKKKPEEMQALRDGTGEWEGKGYRQVAYPQLGQETADEIWDKLEEFAKYSFNKSHSVAYAVIAFRTIFAKYHGLAEFDMAAIRESDDIGPIVSEGRRMGISILPPDILKSQTEISVHDDTIYFGLSNIKGIGKGTANYIVSLRGKYDISSPDLLADAMDAEQAAWEEERDAAKEEGVSFKKKSPRQQFNTKHEGLLYQAGCYDNYGERSDLALPARQKLEKELLGVIITDESEKIFSRNGDLIDECDDWTGIDFGSGRFRLPGVISTVTPKKTKKDNKAMGIVSIEYDGHETEFVVFPQQWANYRFLWKERTPAIFTLKSNERGLLFEEGIKLS